MIEQLLAYRALFDAVLLSAVLALSQYVVLRAGVFSIATAGFAAIGAYVAAGLVLKIGLAPLPALLAGTAAGLVAAVLVALPLACWRVRKRLAWLQAARPRVLRLRLRSLLIRPSTKGSCFCGSP